MLHLCVGGGGRQVGFLVSRQTFLLYIWQWHNTNSKPASHHGKLFQGIQKNCEVPTVCQTLSRTESQSLRRGVPKMSFQAFVYLFLLSIVSIENQVHYILYNNKRLELEKHKEENKIKSFLFAMSFTSCFFFFSYLVIPHGHFSNC